MNCLKIGGIMNNIISQIVDYYKKYGQIKYISVPEIIPSDILSAEEIFEYAFGDSHVIATEGTYADLFNNASTNGKYFSQKLKIYAKEGDLNVKDLIASLGELGLDDEKYYISYETREYQARFSNSMIVSTILIINCKEVASLNYSKAIKGEQTLDIRQIAEYNIDAIREILGQTDEEKHYENSLRDEYENYMEDDGTLENLYLIIERYFLDIQMHKEKSRYILAYNTLLKAIIQNEYIRIKTGTFSDKYKDNIESINLHYREIIGNLIEKYRGN